MNCPICKTGWIAAGHVTVTLDREEVTVVFRHVPAEVCDTCGEYYLDDHVTEALLQRADQEAAGGTAVHVIQYAA